MTVTWKPGKALKLERFYGPPIRVRKPTKSYKHDKSGKWHVNPWKHIQKAPTAL